MATDILARGGTMADVADVLGVGEHIARKHCAKWSPARQQRISSVMSLVQSGQATAQASVGKETLLIQ
jgi:hypothetical protein